MEDVLSDIQFLANSENRIRVLGALTDGPATRRDLQEETGVPRSTAARVLDEAETRGWVDSKGSTYRITPVGDAMFSAFDTYLETTKGIHHLGKAVEWVPEPVHALDFRHFRDARITTSTEGNPTAHFDRGLELLRAADRYRGLTRNSLPEYMKAVRDGVVSGRLDFEGVIESDFVEVLRDEPERAAIWQDIAHRMLLYEGHVPINMHIIDGTVALWLCEENQAGNDVIARGLLETEHPAVVSWAESLYEEYRREAEALDQSVIHP